MIDWHEFFTWMLLGGISAIASYIAKSVGKMSKSIEDLNRHMAVIVERTTNHEKRISKLELKKEKLK